MADWAEDRCEGQADADDQDIEYQASRVPLQRVRESRECDIHLVLEEEMKTIASQRRVSPPREIVWEVGHAISEERRLNRIHRDFEWCPRKASACLESTVRIVV